MKELFRKQVYSPDDLQSDENRNDDSNALVATPLPTAVVNSNSARQRTYELYKKLPKQAAQRAEVVHRLVQRCIKSPSTKAEYLHRAPTLTPAAVYPSKMKTLSARRRTMCVNVPDAVTIQRTIRQISGLRRKGDFLKISAIMETLREKMSMRHIAELGGISYSSLWWMTHKPISHARRYVTAKEKCDIHNLFVRPDVTMQLGWKKFAHKFYMRTRLADAVATYQEEKLAAGERVLARSTILKYRPKSVKTMGKTPYKECQCDYCVNYRLLSDALLAAGVKGVSRRAILNILGSLCAAGSHSHIQQVSDANSNAVTIAADSSDSDTDFDQNVMDSDEEDDPSWFPAPTRTTQAPSAPSPAAPAPDPWDSDYESDDDDATPLPPPPLYKYSAAANGPPSVVTAGCSQAADDNEIAVERSTRTDILECYRACVFRNCTECGYWKLLDAIIQQNTDMDWQKQVFWSNWRHIKEEGYTSFSKVRCQGTLAELLNVFGMATGKLSSHLFNRFWQSQQFRLCKTNLNYGDVIMVMDFGQNLDHKLQDEPQSAHWSRKSTTLHPVVCYYRCQEHDCEELVTEEIMIFSNDLGHDAYQVLDFENMAIKYLYANSVTIKRVFEFTDNCAAQYKSRDCFDMLSARGFPIQRNYFGAKHGKGVADGAIGRLHKDLDAHTRSEQVDVMNAKDLHVHACKRLATAPVVPGICKHSRRRFLLQDKEQVDRSFAMDTVTYPGTMKIHCIRNIGHPGCVEVRPTSCFCR